MNNRKTRRRNKRNHNQTLKIYSENLKPITEQDYKERTGTGFPEHILKCYISRYFFVQIYHFPEKPIRISICRNELKTDGRWADNISWEELQIIKNEVGYPNSDCVEIYPAKADIINVANMRHLWVMDKKLSYAWRNKSEQR